MRSINSNVIRTVEYRFQRCTLMEKLGHRGYETWSRDSIAIKYPNTVLLFKFYEPDRYTGSLS